MAMGMGELGWSPQVFWQSTLPELLAAYRGLQEREKGAYRRAGTIASAIYNVNRKPEADPVHPEDIFPFLLTAEERLAQEWTRITAGIEADDEEQES
ncbi:MAG: hypothetical protein EWM72_02773 [Nitrospira sp.]|nr:MAG: hypothetical protein EWM72_02773 [Nitrospira sp.]